jgi:hypothetical protein
MAQHKFSRKATDEQSKITAKLPGLRVNQQLHIFCSDSLKPLIESKVPTMPNFGRFWGKLGS